MPESTGDSLVKFLIGGGATALITLLVNSLKERRQDAQKSKKEDSETDLKQKEFWDKQSREAYERIHAELIAERAENEKMEAENDGLRRAIRTQEDNFRQRMEHRNRIDRRFLTLYQSKQEMPPELITEIQSQLDL